MQELLCFTLVCTKVSKACYEKVLKNWSDRGVVTTLGMQVDDFVAGDAETNYNYKNYRGKTFAAKYKANAVNCINDNFDDTQIDTDSVEELDAHVMAVASGRDRSNSHYQQKKYTNSNNANKVKQNTTYNASNSKSEYRSYNNQYKKTNRDIICYRCGGGKHTLRECIVKIEDVKCDRCNKFGHMTMFCMT